MPKHLAKQWLLNRIVKSIYIVDPLHLIAILLSSLLGRVAAGNESEGLQLPRNIQDLPHVNHTVLLR